MPLKSAILTVVIAAAALFTPCTVRAQIEATPAFPDLTQALAVARISEAGEDTAAMEYIRARIIAAQLDPATRNELANTLAATLSESDTTYFFKSFVCRHLYLIGGDEQVDALVPLLGNPQLAALARYALEVIPGTRVNDALWEAIPTADANVTAGLAASIAARGGADAVARLSELLSHPDSAVVSAAIVGLGRLGGTDAESALRQSLSTLPESLQAVYYEAMLSFPARMASNGLQLEAGMLYENLMRPPAPSHVREAAFQGLLELRGDAALPMIAEALASSDALWNRMALVGARTCGGPTTTLFLAHQLPTLPAEMQARLIPALADRGDSAALDMITAAAVSPDRAVQFEVIRALGKLGNETSVPLLLSALLGSDAEAVPVAHQSIANMADIGVDNVLLQAYSQGDTALQIALNPLFAERQAREALPALMSAASMPESEVRPSAMAAIALLAREAELPQAAALLYRTTSEDARNDAVRTLVQINRRLPPSETGTSLRRELFDRAPTSLTRAASLEVYRALGDEAMLPILQTATESGDSIVRDAVISALAGWPSPAPLEEVYRLASAGELESHRTTALEGYIRMLQLPSDRPTGDTVGGFKKALELAAGNIDTIRSILSGLSALKSKEALALVDGLRRDPSLHTDAGVAAELIRRAFYVLRASENSEAARQAADDDITTFWSTLGPQQPGQWIEVDMSGLTSLRGIVLDSSRTVDTFPRAYSVHVFNKGAEPGEPIAVGQGTEGVTEIIFTKPATGQIVRIVQTDRTESSPWALHELRVIPD